MSSNALLKAEKREGTGKGVARKLRQAGRIPAVVYGDGETAESLSLDAHDTSVLFHRISVDNTIVSLDIEGEKGAIDTLVREVQVHPFRPWILHVDFLRLRKGVAVDVDVPVHLEGTPEGVRLGGGIVEQNIHALSVRCIPSKIPEVIVVDVTHLDIGDSLHVSELDEIEGVEFLTESIRTICSVALPKAAISEAEEEEDLEGLELMPEGEESPTEESSEEGSGE